MLESLPDTVITPCCPAAKTRAVPVQGSLNYALAFFLVRGHLGCRMICILRLHFGLNLVGKSPVSGQNMSASL